MKKAEAQTTLDIQEGERISGHLELLSSMGQDFATSLDIEETLLQGLKRITDYVGAAGGALFLLDENGEKLTCTACSGATEITGLVLDSDEGIVGRCVQNDVGEIVRDVSKDTNFQNSVDSQTGFTTKSILCAPMSVKEEKIGAIELVNKRTGDGLFDEHDLHLLRSLSSSAALSIKKVSAESLNWPQKSNAVCFLTKAMTITQCMALTVPREPSLAIFMTSFPLMTDVFVSIWGMFPARA
jgi:transcriptional regulator with GAF, ATPase, and Fis domain